MNIKNRLAKLEALHTSQEPPKIWVTMYDDSARVFSGSQELLGKTADEVREIIGKDAIQLIVEYKDKQTNQEYR